MVEPSPIRELLDGLSVAVSTYDRASAADICQHLMTQIRNSVDPIDEAELDSAMGLLRRTRAFDLMADLADAAIAAGQESPIMHRQYAQTLIESGRLAAAEAVLLRRLERGDVRDEVPEIKGLLGRIYKQRYVDIGDPNASGAREALHRGIDVYLAVYQADTSRTWHGINAVALLARGRRDGVEVEGPDQEAMAQGILQHVAARWRDGLATGWDAGTAMEAAVALGDAEAARTWLTRYVDSPATDAFALASSIRQLQQVWELDGNSDIGDIVEVLRAYTIDRGDGASIQVAGPVDSAGFERRSGGLEKTFGQVGAVTVRWWLQAQDRLKAIARIEDVSGEPVGTGFVVEGGDISEKWRGELLMLTNAHVVSREFSTALLPEEGWVNFTQLGTDERYRVDDLLFESDPLDLDCAVLRLESIPDGVKPLPLAARLPDAEGGQRLYVMGHPRGGELKISIDDNLLIDHDDVKVHYRAPTEPGSSGSPVFDRTWQLIALHHSGHDAMTRLRGKAGTYAANEGLSLGAIKTSVAGVVLD